MTTTTTSLKGKISINGEYYDPLAPGSGWPDDGVFDYVVLGSGLTNSLLCGLLATKKGASVLHVDSERFYGGSCASLSLDALFQKTLSRDPTTEEREVLGNSSDYNIDLVPKAMLSSGKLAKILVHTGALRYLDFRPIGETFMYKGTRSKLFPVPATVKAAIKSDMMGFFQKRRFQQFLSFVEKCNTEDLKSLTTLKYDVTKLTMSELYKTFGLGKTECDLAGHVLGLQRDDLYLEKPAIQTIRTIRLYVKSLSVFGRSAFIYPEYGLGGLAEACCRLCTIHGGIYLLNEKVDEILFDKSSGDAIGVRCGKKAAIGRHIIAEPAYVPKRCLVAMGEGGQRVVRSVFVLDHEIKHTDSESCQIIIPQQQVELAGLKPRKHDIFINCLSYIHRVAPTRRWVAIVSTVVEGKSSKNPYEELNLGVQMLGKTLARFDLPISEMVAPKDEKSKTLFISRSLDATSNFETVADDVMLLWKRITGNDLDMSVGMRCSTGGGD